MRYYLFVFLLMGFNYFWLGTEDSQNEGNSKFEPYSENIPGSDILIEMVPIHGGTYLMGSPITEDGRNSDEGPQKSVMVNSFWMGTYEISWEQYSLFLDEKPENIRSREVKLKDGSTHVVDGVATATPMYIDMSFGMGRKGFPAVNMTHYAAMMYARWLYTKTGNFYRLPTEAEWEYACRAGTSTAYHFGSDPKELSTYAWFQENAEKGYGRVGTKAPNAYGLYDMHGNVAEWTADQYTDNYFKKIKKSPADNPYLKPTTLYPRTVRGGSWMDTATDLRSASRLGSTNKWKIRDPQMPKSIWWLTEAPFVGFRLVRPRETPSKEEIENYWIQAMDDF